MILNFDRLWYSPVGILITERDCTQPRASDFFFSSVERTEVVGYRVLVQVKVEVVNFMARADEINIKGAYALLLQKEGAKMRNDRAGQLLERTKWGCRLWVPRTVVSSWPKISPHDVPVWHFGRRRTLVLVRWTKESAQKCLFAQHPIIVANEYGTGRAGRDCGRRTSGNEAEGYRLFSSDACCCRQMRKVVLPAGGCEDVTTADT